MEPVPTLLAAATFFVAWNVLVGLVLALRRPFSALACSEKPISREPTPRGER